MNRAPRGLATQFLLGAITAGSLFAGILYIRSGSPVPLSTPASPEALATLSHRLGLEPRAMAAAGFSAAHTQAVMTQLREQSAELAAALAEADRAFAEAFAERDRLIGLIQSGGGQDSDVSALSAAESRLGQAAAERSTWIQTTLSDASRGINADVLNVLQTIRGGYIFDDALPFAAAVREQEATVNLRDALACERLASADGLPVPEDAARIISAERSTPAVATARALLDTNQAAVTEAWNAVVRARQQITATLRVA